MIDDKFLELSNNRTALIREVFEYSTRYKDATFIFRINANLLDFENICDDLALLHKNGTKIAIIPSCHNRIEELLDRYQIKTNRENGIRVSTAEAIPIIEMAAFDMATRFINSLSKHHVEAIVGNWVKARALGVINGIDYQFTGSVDKISLDLIRRSLEDNFVPILPSIGWSSIGEPYNISSIELATRLAIALNAKKLFFVSDGNLFNKIEPANFTGATALPGRPGISRLKLETAEEIIKAKIISEDSSNLAILKNAIMACRQGIERIHFLDGKIPGAILNEIFSERGIGTLMHVDPYEDIRPMEPRDIGEVMRIMEPMIARGALIRRSDEDIISQIDNYVVFVSDNSVRGCAALQRLSDDSVELSALSVDENYKELGIGQRLAEYLMERAKNSNYHFVFALTTVAPDWFERLGFEKCNIDDLPMTKKVKYNQDRNSRVYRYKLKKF